MLCKERGGRGGAWERPRSELVAFLARGGYFVRGARGGDKPQLTHTLMDGERGGCVSVPSEATKEFFAAYGKDLASGVPLFVVERRSDVFKMHLDVDFKSMASDEDVRRLLDVACSAVRACFADRPEEARCLCCAAQRTPPRFGGNRPAAPRQTPGLHLHFPAAVVDEAFALRVRAAVVDACERELPWPGVTWSSAVDAAVLRSGGGLRLNGSDKCRPCEECGGHPSRRLFCAGCGRRGSKAQGKVYWPWAAWPFQDAEAQAMLRRAVENPAHGVRLCSTRVAEGTAATWTLKKRCRGLEDADGDLGQLRRRGAACSESLPPRAQEALVDALRAAHPSWRHLELRSTARVGGGSFLVRVAGPGARFCLNKGCEHQSQSIYFVLGAEGLSQRCFSRKACAHRFGLCEDFAAIPFPLSLELREALFDATETSL